MTALALWTLFVGCVDDPLPPPPPNVVLVTLEAVRGDRLGVGGYAAASTPTIDGLAASGRRYTSAWSPHPQTIPAHAALFTGLYPPRVGVRRSGDPPLEPTFTTLAEVLHDAGWQTAAATGAFATTRRWGLAQGFDAYFDALAPGDDPWSAERSGEAVVDDALAWKRTHQASGPLFLWVHLPDAAAPHAPVDGAPADRAPYDGEIATVDAQVGRLVDAFVGQPTLFVVVGDHGEGLGDHGEQGHGWFVYGSTQRVPFLISGPGVSTAVIEEPVSLVDVLPTVLDLVDVSIPAGLDGRVTPTGAPRAIYLESHELRDRFGIAPHVGVIEGPLALIATPRPELYDWVADPGQTTDLSASRPADVARLQGQLGAWGFEPPGPAAGGAFQVLSDARFRGDLGGPLPDPKDRADLLAATQTVDRMQRDGDLSGAASLLGELAAAHPDVLAFQSRRAGLLIGLDRAAEARPIVDAVLAAEPDNLGMLFLQADLLAREGQFALAADRYEGVAERSPWLSRARALAVAARLADPDDPDGGPALVDRYAREHPEDVGPIGVYGVWLWRAGRLAEARPVLQAALQGPRPERGVAFALASLERGRGNVEGARELLQEEIAAWPDHREARDAWMRESAELRRWREVVTQAEALIALDATSSYGRSGVDVWHARAQALFNLGEFQRARAALDEARTRFPEDSDLWMLEANLRKKEGREAEAQAAFERAKAARARETKP